MNQSLAAKIGWVFAIAVAIASCVIMQMRLGSLPNLNVELGPDLFVRGTKIMQNEDADAAVATIQTGDKILTLGGQRVEDLRDVRIAALGAQKKMGRGRDLASLFTSVTNEPLPADKSLIPADQLGVDVEKWTAPTFVPLSYQSLRPRHVFLVSLKDSGGVTKDIYNLMRPDDTLLEIDGRRLPNPVGIEAARSVVNSRPEAVLTIERHDALFSGNLYTALSTPISLIQVAQWAAYAFIFIVFVVLFIIGRRTNNLAAASMTALESVLFAWIALLTYRYMWVLADPIIRGGVIISLVFFRPVSGIAVAFSQSRSNLLSSGFRGANLWFSLLAATIAGAALLVVNSSNNPESWELAPQVAGLVMLFFLVYEVISGFTLRARSPIVDRSGYVAGIIGLTCLGAVFAYFTGPNAFLEGRWCMFIMILVGLIWSADLVYVLTGNKPDQMSVVESQTGRANLILDYLERLHELSFSTAFGLVIWRPTGAVMLRRERDALVVENTTKSLHDAIAILIQEQAIIPFAGNFDPHEDPMAGIATTMGLSLAFTMAPPEDAIIVDNAELIAVGFDANTDPADSLPLPIEVLQTVQDLMTPEVWLSSFLEALAFSGFAADATAAEAGELDILREKAKELAQQKEMISAENGFLAAQRELFLSQLLDLSPRDFDFEPQLIESFDYLLKTTRPIVISGDFFSGKKLTACAAAVRDPHFDGKKHVLIDAAKSPIDSMVDEAMLEYLQGATLIVENAQALSAQELKFLVLKAHENYRLYLLFVDTTLGRDTVLKPYSTSIPDVFDALHSRELVLPQLWRRKDFLQSAINLFCNEAASVLKKDVTGFSDRAFAYLQELPWSGGLLELKLVVFYCVAHTQELIIDDELILKFWGETA